MTKIFIAAILVVATISAGCASNRTSSRVDSASELSSISTADTDGAVASNRGMVAYLWGDTHTSTLLFERAVAADPSPLNKFNLASAYRNEGREAEALALYDQVAREGKHVEAVTMRTTDERGPRSVGFNLAEGARERAAASRERLRLAPRAATGGAVSASPAATATDLTPPEAAALDAGNPR